MTVLLTTVARVRDWKALQKLHHTVLVGRAREVGVTRYRIYRNTGDAAQALIVAEAPEPDALRDLSRYLDEEIAVLIDGDTIDERIWEPIELEGIG